MTCSWRLKFDDIRFSSQSIYSGVQISVSSTPFIFVRPVLFIVVVATAKLVSHWLLWMMRVAVLAGIRIAIVMVNSMLDSSFFVFLMTTFT